MTHWSGLERSETVYRAMDAALAFLQEVAPGPELARRKALVTEFCRPQEKVRDLDDKRAQILIAMIETNPDWQLPAEEITYNQYLAARKIVDAYEAKMPVWNSDVQKRTDERVHREADRETRLEYGRRKKAREITEQRERDAEAELHRHTAWLESQKAETPATEQTHEAGHDAAGENNGED